MNNIKKKVSLEVVLKNYDFELDFIISEINKNKYKTIGIQLPEGVKMYAIFISDYIKKQTNSNVIISADICFGACDLDLTIINYIDALFHFGHSPILSCIPINLKHKIYFIELKCYFNVEKVAQKIKNYLCKNINIIGLTSTIQYVHQLQDLRNILNQNTKFQFIIGNGDKRISYPGQIIGCNFSCTKNYINNKCERYIYIGNGDFHPIGISITTKKDVICIDPNSLEIKEINNKTYFMKRHAIISNLIELNPKKYGILISTKPGQYREKLAKLIDQKISSLKLSAYIIFVNLITPDILRSFDVDVFINTACPRLAIDDSSIFHVPVITPKEFEIIIGDKMWENLEIDEILEP